jgi:hypothetical protein
MNVERRCHLRQRGYDNGAIKIFMEKAHATR